MLSYRGARGLCCVAWIVFSAGCEAGLSAPATPTDTQRSELESDGAAGVDVGGDVELACEPSDGADTTCNGVDDDCDGTLDEDCDFGPADCPAGTNVIVGDHGRDWLWGTSGRDCILGYGGDDMLWGMDGGDVLVGGPGNDVLIGWGGDDWLLGDRGDDSLFGDGGHDRLDGGEGNDVLLGGLGNDDVRGGACHDQLVGLAGTDSLFGEEGVDRIVAGSPHHRDGGSGIDACTGTSCELSGSAARFCLRDSDCGAGKRCVYRAFVCVAESELVLTDATCDGFDDDCDGTDDEDYASVATSCGVGACGGSGMTTCEDGVVVDSCTGTGPSGAMDGSCDAVDDDCDGYHDEDYASVATSCGAGACAATGATMCTSGTVVDSCTAGTPAPDDASCDGVDDDCDGAADEHYAATITTCGVGACGAVGGTVCTSGSVVDSCTPGVPAEDDASCNAVDDDCDGYADEEYASVATSCGVGACAAVGTTACTDGAIADSCLAGLPAAADATCDGVDDDCDGVTDEDYMPVATSCGVGACAATGVTACTAGAVVDSCTAGTAAADDATCDAIDDDCDGVADDDYAPVVTTCEVGGCLAQGATACTAGMEEDLCSTQPTCIAELACDDGIDNDGDAFADCGDADCQDEEQCQTQIFDLTVDGQSNPWGAGHAAAPGGGLLPPGVVLELGAGAVVTFSAVTGEISDGEFRFVPDGRSGTTNAPSGGGIAGYTHSTRSRGMVGVFIGDAEPINPAPARLAFPNGEFAELAPELHQIFYIGNGQQAAGTLQRFIVPAGATRLFLGFSESCSTTRLGCFADNSGSYQVHGEIAFDP